MAWIMKNSAAMQIERRDEPYLNDAMKAKLESEIIPRYPSRKAATLPALHMVQHEHNWIPHQAIEEVGTFLGVAASEVLDTATFYEEFWLQPKGKYLIMVCQSIACEILGTRQLVDKLTEKLGVGPGQTTEDGRFTLMTAECLGGCGGAPCALVNEKLYENLSAENIDRILDALD